jgi:hypothetical protein
MWRLTRTAKTLEAEWRQIPRGSVGMGEKEDESNTGQVWAAGFHLVTTRSRLVHVLKIMNHYLFNFQFFFRPTVNRGYLISGYGGTTVYETYKHSVWAESRDFSC